MEQEIRSSQTIHTYGPGAIADFPELSVLILSHDIPQDYRFENAEFWGEDAESPDNKIIDDRLASAFNVDCFVSAPTSESVTGAKIQTVRFPSIAQCPITGELFDIREMEMDNENEYYIDRTSRSSKTVDETFSGYDSPNNKYRKLIPVRWVIATEDGYLDDFPFDWYVHVKLGLLDEIGKGNRLYLKSSGNSASLKNIKLESRHRNTGSLLGFVSLAGIFDQEDTFVDLEDPRRDYMQYVKNRLPKPWYGRLSVKSNRGIKEFKTYVVDDLPYPPYNTDATEEEKRRQLSKYPRTLLRGAGNLYFPIVYKGISLPKNGYNVSIPEDFVMRFQNAIKSWEDIIQDTGDIEEYIELLRKVHSKKFSDLPYSLDQCVKLAKKYFESFESQKPQYTVEQLREQEFNCFLNENVHSKKSEWYSSRILDGKQYRLAVENLIDKVVLLDKLKELKIFRGFTRIKPLMFDDLIFDNPEKITGRRKREFARIQDPRSEKGTNTLPCSEVKGEGIFIKFNNEVLRDWEARSSVKSRFQIIQNNNNHYRRTFGLEEDEMISPRYVLLHTLSHILINELAIECGYGSSSLSEIIYTGNNSDSKMNGILIYTSTSDSEGTLGGLVEKGEPTFLCNVIEKAIGKASWCSSDPLCLETKSGKGFMAVNLGACHSCCLLPETSCCNMNKFLDRALLIGSLTDPEIGLFSS
ncbi:DUF1998 domain-containing protein [Aestuariivivens sediminicola]|uniref:DUF1998 domain-containing protein n=1 Tax=Aestuariivivens sediminicola TaxID=2913560 RepID=UPI001F566AF3|nr:DUF1998 domain-containing protein [Aestuariivivens sediminicola]